MNFQSIITQLLSQKYAIVLCFFYYGYSLAKPPILTPHCIKTMLKKRNPQDTFGYLKILNDAKPLNNEFYKNEIDVPIRLAWSTENFNQPCVNEVDGPIRLVWSAENFNDNVQTILENNNQPFLHTYQKNFVPIIHYLNKIDYRRSKKTLCNQEYTIIKAMLESNIDPNTRYQKFNVAPQSAIEDEFKECFNQELEPYCQTHYIHKPAFKKSYSTSQLIPGLRTVVLKDISPRCPIKATTIAPVFEIPLHEAVKNGDKNLVQLLLDYKADVNILNTEVALNVTSWTNRTLPIDDHVIGQCSLWDLISSRQFDEVIDILLKNNAMIYGKKERAVILNNHKYVMGKSSRIKSFFNLLLSAVKHQPTLDKPILEAEDREFTASLFKVEHQPLSKEKSIIKRQPTSKDLKKITNSKRKEVVEYLVGKLSSDQKNQLPIFIDIFDRNSVPNESLIYHYISQFNTIHKNNIDITVQYIISASTLDAEFIRNFIVFLQAINTYKANIYPKQGEKLCFPKTPQEVKSTLVPKNPFLERNNIPKTQNMIELSYEEIQKQFDTDKSTDYEALNNLVQRYLYTEKNINSGFQSPVREARNSGNKTVENELFEQWKTKIKINKKRFKEAVTKFLTQITIG